MIESRSSRLPPRAGVASKSTRCRQCLKVWWEPGEPVNSATRCVIYGAACSGTCSFSCTRIIQFWIDKFLYFDEQVHAIASLSWYVPWTARIKSGPVSEKKLGRYILGGDVLILVALNYNIENADNISQQILVVRVLTLIWEAKVSRKAQDDRLANMIFLQKHCNTGGNNAVVYQNWQISGMSKAEEYRLANMIFLQKHLQAEIML